MKRAFLVLLLVSAPAAAAPPTKAEWQAVVDKAIAYLKKSQNEDGSWGTDPQNRGVTGIVVTGLLSTGRRPRTTRRSPRALKFIESLINAKDGHIAGNDAEGRADQLHDQHQRHGPDRRRTRRQVQGGHRQRGQVPQEVPVGRGRGQEGTDSDYYGGAGYDGDKSRPDLSNTAFFLEALKDGRRAARTTRPSRRRWSSSAAARTSRASSTRRRGPRRTTTAASSTPGPTAARTAAPTATTPRPTWPATAA